MKKHLLRIFVLSIVLCLTSIVSKAQWVTIPDTAFVSYLQATFPACMNGNLMDTTCSGVVGANGVYCNNRPIRDLEGIQYFDSLQILNCQQDSISNLTILPSSLTNLSCDVNKITTLLNLPPSLVQLSCGRNQLTSLPTLPDSLTDLYCLGNQLTSLPFLPVSLTYLNCMYNLITSLPTLPTSLHVLLCFYNQLTSLPFLPYSLAYMECGYNQLTNLPTLPTSLVNLSCGYNQLTNLPTLPASLVNLYCGNNQLTSLPTLPDSLANFYCNDNPNLHCLPELKKIQNFQFYNTGITCLPNYPQGNVTSNPSFNTYPLCDTSSFNIYGCGTYWNISGKVYVDSNANCNYDVGENTFGNLKVQLYENGILEQQNYSSQGGVYSLNTDLSTYQYSIDTSDLPFSVSCPDSGYNTSSITALDSFDADMNFGLKCKPGFDLTSLSIVPGHPLFFPAAITPVITNAGDYSNFYNAHCAAGTSGSVYLIINGAAHYFSVDSNALVPTSIVNDTVTWSIADFGAVNFFSAFNINVATDTTAVLGSQICFTLIINPIAGDNNPTNNILTYCSAVSNSYDPNEKEVYPAGNIDTSQKWLTYTIHFQNTGTAEAQHIYVTDTLDANVDPASFQLLAYSHQPMVQLKENAVRFNFPNINLPDSNANEAASHGYVQYKVKLKNNLPVGTNIINTAFIYFDFNSPVVTNTTTNTIANIISHLSPSLSEGEGVMQIQIYPNPAKSFATISVSENVIGSNLVVTDVMGRRVAAAQLKTLNYKLETSAFASGVYFVTIENERTRVTKKLIIQK